MDTLRIINKYYRKNPKAKRILLIHANQVSKKAFLIARDYEMKAGKKVDKQFLKEAAMLHDIGMIETDAPKIFCHGKCPYIMHGVLGAAILRREGKNIGKNLERHAKVCERHVGVGLTRKEIEKARLPLPKRDMIPLSVEEKIICIADKFFSKRANRLGKEYSLNHMREEIMPYGNAQLKRFEGMAKELGL